MYEQAFRLSQYGTIEALEKQVKCYLASVNAFCLCDSKYAWVLKPVDADIEEEVIELPSEAGSEMVTLICFISKNNITIIRFRNLKSSNLKDN